MFSNCQNFFFLADCLASYATETVMQYCHGRRRCNLTADQKTFGKPCMPESRMYLKVVYTCGKFLLMKLRASWWCGFQQLLRVANERWKETKKPLQWRNESRKLSALVPVIDLWFPIKEKLPLSQQSRNDPRWKKKNFANFFHSGSLKEHFQFSSRFLFDFHPFYGLQAFFLCLWRDW